MQEPYKGGFEETGDKSVFRLRDRSKEVIFIL